MPKKLPSNCPECRSSFIQVYDVNIVTGKEIYFCNSCNHLWSEKIKLLEYKGHFNIKKLKEDRKRFNYLGKIKPNDVTNIIVDLFILGGRTFYKKKRRYKRRKK